MNTQPSLARRLLRIDPRSLGLFRILFGFVLMADLCQRWRWLTAFYSNDGVLPNHAHLFQLKDHGRVWSALHAFSVKDEAFAAFCVTLAFYAFFTLGLFTRVAAVASAVALVSLAGRNILMNGIGDSLAVSLLLVAVFLPLGARYSLDALARGFAAHDEHDANGLNDRSQPPRVEIEGSLAALVMLFVVGIVPFAGAVQQNGGAWSRGDALYYALHSDRWLSAFGEAVRNKVPFDVLAAWTKLLRIAEFVVLPLALVPVAPRITRGIAMGALAFVGATFAFCFNYGAYGFGLLAAVALLIPEETWDARPKGDRKLRVIYDDDCGMCLWLARLLKRLDHRENLTFVGNSAVAEGSIEGLPASVTTDTVERTLVVLDASNTAHEEGAAIAQLLFALPLGGVFGRLASLPGIAGLLGMVYRRVAARRLDISVACGLGACGLPSKEDEENAAYRADVFPPSTKITRSVATGLTSLLVGFVFATFLAATDVGNELPFRTGLGKIEALRGAASYARITAPWGIWAPEPALRNETIVTVATMRDERELDVLNGLPPDLELAIPSRHRLGPLWAAYADNLRHDETVTFRQELRRYLVRGGKIADDQDAPPGTMKLSTYWVSAPIPAPGQAPSGELERTELLDTAALPRPNGAPTPNFGREPSLRHGLRLPAK